MTEDSPIPTPSAEPEDDAMIERMAKAYTAKVYGAHADPPHGHELAAMRAALSASGLLERERVLREALLMAGAHCQGGHSEAGHMIATTFGIPFPLTMLGLCEAADRNGFDAAKLWPWYARTALSNPLKAD